MTNGRQCQSPALRGGPLCFFHAKLQHTHRRPAKPESLASGWQEYAIESEGEPEGDVFAVARVYPNQDEIQFPPLEDAESVQLATSMLFQAIATGQIYFKRAKLLLYTLKIASINQRALANARATDSDKPAPTRIHPHSSSPDFLRDPAEGAAGALPSLEGTPKDSAIPHSPSHHSHQTPTSASQAHLESSARQPTHRSLSLQSSRPTDSQSPPKNAAP